MKTIKHDDLREAEKKLMGRYRIVGNSKILFETTGVDREGLDRMFSEHWEYLKEKFPNMEEEYTAPLNTMFRHFMLVGVMAGRNAQKDRFL